MDTEIRNRIFNINNEKTFRDAALEVFHFQAASVPVYRDYLVARDVDPGAVKKVEEIPFLPIEFFKTHKVLAEGRKAEVVFESSGTAGTESSRHRVVDVSIYRESFLRGFYSAYGSPEELCILALLPSYLEHPGSSLVYMMDRLIHWSKHPDSGFHLDNLDRLAAILRKRNDDGQSTLLLGVSFALLDLAEQYPAELKDNITVIETGGMKGRREELVRSELHGILKEAFGLATVHSEYGMTELLSQSYSRGDGIFIHPPWMKVLARDPNDPLSLMGEGQTGGLNIIDLANMYSCSFIATDDLGKYFGDGSFEVLGRFGGAEIRGCNLLVS
jgi:phenylacetate-coenzyme A ligase PaaK-like adenylate-forming protein